MSSRLTSTDLAALIMDRLPPGGRLEFDRDTLHAFDEARHCSLEFLEAGGGSIDVVDRAFQKIVGASYEYFYFHNPDTRNIAIIRLREPLTDGRRSWVSPDRRHLFTFDPSTCTYSPIQPGANPRIPA